jgi:hypothetical protein
MDNHMTDQVGRIASPAPPGKGRAISVPRREVLAAFADAPAIDPQRFRDDLDGIAEPALVGSAYG